MERITGHSALLPMVRACPLHWKGTNSTVNELHLEMSVPYKLPQQGIKQGIGQVRRLAEQSATSTVMETVRNPYTEVHNHAGRQSARWRR
jgi:hypothetical protein